MNPTVSIIVPVYNAEATLSHCVDSVLNQQYTDFELLLVNDGSTDGSGAICREYVWAYPPGIPLLAPGQQVTGAGLRSLAEMASSGVELHSTSGRLPEELEVVRSLA